MTNVWWLFIYDWLLIMTIWYWENCIISIIDVFDVREMCDDEISIDTLVIDNLLMLLTSIDIIQWPVIKYIIVYSIIDCSIIDIVLLLMMTVLIIMVLWWWYRIVITVILMMIWWYWWRYCCWWCYYYWWWLIIDDHSVFIVDVRMMIWYSDRYRWYDLLMTSIDY